MRNLKNIMFYGGLTKECYEEIKEDINETNRRDVDIFSIMAVCTFSVLAFITGIWDISISYNHNIFILAAINFIVIGILNRLIGKWRNVGADLMAMVFVFCLLGSGIAMDLQTGIEELAVVFPVFLFAISIFFTLRPLNIAMIILIKCAIFLGQVMVFQTGKLRSDNITDCLIFGFSSIVCGMHVVGIRIDHLYQLHKNQIMIETDILTGLYNRRKYDEQLQKIKSEGGVYTLVALDVDGLKKTNDTLGHAAGDDLLKGAAACIKKVFGPMGECFRIGGDEFFVIINDTVTRDQVQETFAGACENYRGTYVSEVSVSYGVINSVEHPGTPVEEMVILADQLLYKDKQSKKGKRRE
ncbi:MAG: GGDEF domain-containing protein [Lachnospiraceae bacterium]|nr:GGDEF domain-containing protein [Lachnospiraceae bacterium]